MYRSPDLIDWTYLHPLFEGDLPGKSNPKNPVASGEMWECPSFFALGDKHVLFVSTQGTTPFHVGRYVEEKFHAESNGRLDCGAYYAPITQLDEGGRRILWGWIQERRSREAQVKAGWSGVLLLPRVLTIRKDGRLGIDPALQCRSLRGTRRHFANLAIPDNRPLRVADVEGDALEILADFHIGGAGEIGLRVLEDVPIVYNVAAKRLTVGEPGSEANGQFALDPGESLRLNVFIDCSVIEVFVNGRGCYTGRAYPEDMSRLGVSLHARGESAKLKSMVVYEMKPISNDRSTGSEPRP